MEDSSLMQRMVDRCGIAVVALSVMLGANIVLADTPVSSVPVTFYFGVETPAPVTDPAQACSGAPENFTDGCYGWPVAPHPDHPDTINFFHTDLEIPYVGCGWDLNISPNDRTPSPQFPNGDRRVEPEDGLLYVNHEARWNLGSVPPGFEFIGLIPNETFWILPQNQETDVLWLGFASEDGMGPPEIALLAEWNPNDPLGRANSNAKWLKVYLVDVRGPAGGEFSVWQTTGGGSPIVYMSTYDGGITDEDVYYITAGGHVHLNMALTKPGLYEIDFRVETVLAADLLNDPRYDRDGDMDVDSDDFGAFQRCLSGSGKAYVGCDCEWADGDLDGDVDAADRLLFEACSSGPAIAAIPACDD